MRRGRDVIYYKPEEVQPMMQAANDLYVKTRNERDEARDVANWLLWDSGAFEGDPYALLVKYPWLRKSGMLERGRGSD